jgi:hypothetical protein
LKIKVEVNPLISPFLEKRGGKLLGKRKGEKSVQGFGGKNPK